MTLRKLPPHSTSSILHTRSGESPATGRVRIVFGERCFGEFGTVGRAVGSSLKDIPTGAKVLDPSGRVRARLDHIVSAKGTWLAGWVMVL